MRKYLEIDIHLTLNCGCTLHAERKTGYTGHGPSNDVRLGNAVDQMAKMVDEIHAQVHSHICPKEHPNAHR